MFKNISQAEAATQLGKPDVPVGERRGTPGEGWIGAEACHVWSEVLGQARTHATVTA